MIRNMDFTLKDEFKANEDELNYLNHHLVEIIVKLSSKDNISKKDYLYLTSTYKTISDLERIGDHLININDTDYVISH